MTSQAIKRTIALIALTGYVFLALFSLAGISSHHIHADMGMENCPYALGTHSLCPMNAFAHIEAWESAMRVIVPFFTFILICIAAWAVWPSLLDSGPPTFLKRRPERQYSFYVHLFSSGILNPKIP